MLALRGAAMRTIEELAEAVTKAIVGYALEVSIEEMSWITNAVDDSEGMFEIVLFELLSKRFPDIMTGENLQLIVYRPVPLDFIDIHVLSSDSQPELAPDSLPSISSSEDDVDASVRLPPSVYYARAQRSIHADIVERLEKRFG
jgi:hypothetical protein